MAHLAEPHRAGPDLVESTARDGELAALVRRWVGARRAVVRVAPPPLSTPDDPEDRDDAVESAPEPEPEPRPEAAAEPEPAPDPPSDRATRTPSLPHRPGGEDTEHATRLAVLVDARRVPEDVAAGLLARLGDRGAVNVCRAYGDWRRADLGSWVERLRREGMHSFHQFTADDDQALVALAIDAVDIAREASVDEVVLAGDMTSMLPLVHRLHGAGVRVLVVGPADTPHAVRSACDEFLDQASVVGEPTAPAGRHRA
ncbi:hypothetical protein GCM10011376_38340 [Nocardioides flavus (ex Wang et al. 2016)]|uniref:NYN domain-containing protein n=1 Tax=Nocardioides flavus (ex Wang et al. 2016) TaxID=2058780 RepID=A0ABQ3HRG2_9ACTN|nr:NYN domain-containing protein [Nocardioides flavus (ex Wang et al. 2016)]GHE19224.1 hypothetical protein GCM10011376_38340 [Nocardioides flavus (ex Wang et al. 2016)]